MRSPRPSEACERIATEHAENRIAAIGEERATRVATELENYGKTLTQLADVVAHDRMISDSEEAGNG